MKLLRQSTAQVIKLGPFVSATDGATAETGLTIGQADIQLSQGGAAFAQSHNAAGATHDRAGWYDVTLDEADTDTLGELVISVQVAGALPVWERYTVVPAEIYDAVIGGTTELSALLQALLEGVSNTALTDPTLLLAQIRRLHARWCTTSTRDVETPNVITHADESASGTLLTRTFLVAHTLETETIG